MHFEEWWSSYINTPCDDYHGLSRQQMWNESVLKEHEQTARAAWAQAAISIGNAMIKGLRETLSKIDPLG